MDLDLGAVFNLAWKTFGGPMIAVGNTTVDAAPFVMLFIVFFVVILIMISKLKGWKLQLSRKIVQMVSFFICVILFYICICIDRSGIYGMRNLFLDDLWAFTSIYIIILPVIFGLSFGRIFCGWICPLGFVLEIAGKVDNFKRRNITNKKILKLLEYTGLTISIIVVIYFGWLFRPGALYFQESIGFFWGIWLFLILFWVMSNRYYLDKKAKRIRYVSLILWITAIVLGIYVYPPFCAMITSEFHFSTLMSMSCAFICSMFISMSWCRYLCPVGTILALVSRHSLFRLINKNREPSFYPEKSEQVCLTGALGKNGIDQSSCFYCGSCLKYGSKLCKI